VGEYADRAGVADDAYPPIVTASADAQARSHAIAEKEEDEQ
jgi:hypothetical protein